MRLDLFLKASRLCSRRTIAQKICEAGRVSVNGGSAKSSHAVKAGDEILIRRHDKLTTLRVLSVPTARQTSRKDATTLYEVVSEELLDNLTMKRFLLLIVLLATASCLACQQRATLAGEPSRHATPTASEEGQSVPQPLQQSAALKLPLKNPRIVVIKSKRRLELYSDGALVRTYRVGLGLNPVPDKKRQGDRATPEGEFYLFTKNDKSAFYLSLGISYPNAEYAERGLRDGLISRGQHDAIVRAIKRKGTPPQNTALGGDIYIHGNGASSDWTWGCVALENEDMRELFGAVSVGTPVTIKP